MHFDVECAIYYVGLFAVLMQSFYSKPCLAVDASPVTETIACSNAADVIDVAKTTAEVATEVTPEITHGFLGKVLTKLKSLYEKTTKLPPAPDPVTTVIQSFFLLHEAKNAVCSTKSWLLPSNKEALAASKMGKERDILLAKRALKDCLVLNAYDKRGRSGRPQVCEETAHMFAMMAGNTELEKTTKIFNKIRDAHVTYGYMLFK